MAGAGRMEGDAARTPSSEEALARATAETAARLRQRGVRLDGDESPEALVRLLEGVEAFEGAVMRAGGDLMVDEPPAGQAGEPEDARFALPRRGEDEGVEGYLRRLAAGARRIEGREGAG